MNDSTSVVYCKCGCGQELNKVRGGQRYINNDHTEFANRLKKAKIKERELKKAWRRNDVALASRFFEIFGEQDIHCDVCRKSYEENLREWNLPLNIILKDEIRDYRVLLKESYHFYCLKCFVEITFIKENI